MLDMGIKWTWANKKYLAKIACALTGTLYAILGFIGTLAPIDEILPSKISLFHRIIISLIIVASLWLICFCIVSLFNYKTEKVKVMSVNNGHALYLQYGDLFGENEINQPGCRRNIIIPVNTCFDTIVDDVLVSSSTLHGKAFLQLYNSGAYTVNSLNQTIQQLLSNTNHDVLSPEEKPAGNRNRYPVGTVVDIPGIGNEHYLLWALSTFDNNLKAQTSMQDYALAVQRLVESCNLYSEGFPILIPLIGTGLSRTKKCQQDVLSYLLASFHLNKEEINSDVHIIIRKELKPQITIIDK